MQKSRDSLVEYWSSLSPDSKSRLADAVGSTVGYLRQVFLYSRKPGGARARVLADQTGLDAYEFRPDIFQRAELIQQPKPVLKHKQKNKQQISLLPE